MAIVIRKLASHLAVIGTGRTVPVVTVVADVVEHGLLQRLDACVAERIRALAIRNRDVIARRFGQHEHDAVTVVLAVGRVQAETVLLVIRGRVIRALRRRRVGQAVHVIGREEVHAHVVLLGKLGALRVELGKLGFGEQARFVEDIRAGRRRRHGRSAARFGRRTRRAGRRARRAGSARGTRLARRVCGTRFARLAGRARRARRA